MAVNTSAAINTESIMRNILSIRAHRVLLDSELASLYQVETKVVTRAVRRNAERFPADFMYQLTAEEAASLRGQIGALKTGRGRHRKYAPYVFTEQGDSRRILTTECSRCISEVVISKALNRSFAYASNGS